MNAWLAKDSICSLHTHVADTKCSNRRPRGDLRNPTYSANRAIDMLKSATSTTTVLATGPKRQPMKSDKENTWGMSRVIRLPNTAISRMGTPDAMAYTITPMMPAKDAYCRRSTGYAVQGAAAGQRAVEYEGEGDGHSRQSLSWKSKDHC